MDDYRDGARRRVHSRYERWSANARAGLDARRRATRVEVSGALSDGEAAYADRTMDGVEVRARERRAAPRASQRLAASSSNVEAQVFYNYVDHVMDNYSLRHFTPSMMMPGRSVSNPDRRTMGGRASSTCSSAVDACGTRRHRLAGAIATRCAASSNQSTDPYEAPARTRDARSTTSASSPR